MGFFIFYYIALKMSICEFNCWPTCHAVKAMATMLAFTKFELLTCTLDTEHPQHSIFLQIIAQTFWN